MAKANCVHSTPPTNSPISQVDASSRRRFLSSVAGIAAGGTVLALATIPPVLAATAPTDALDPANASPALCAATRALGDAHDRLKQARSTFDAADLLPGEWRRLNPEPTGRRAIKRWNRREREYRYSVTMPPWEALLSAERDFQAAQTAVANIKARDMSELALKACLSSVYDCVRTTDRNPAVIGFSVSLDLIRLTMVAT